MEYLLERLREPSTWRGLAVLATAAGVTLSPEQMEAIIPVGLLVSGLIGVFAPERKP